MAFSFFFASGVFAAGSFFAAGFGGGSGREIYGTPFDDRLRGTDGRDDIDGRAGDDLIEGFGGNDTLAGKDGFDDIYGDEGDDILTGGNGRDLLVGGPGSDRIGAGRAADTLEGGRGDDLLAGDAEPDRLFGGPGRDTLSGGAGDDLLDGGHGDDTLDGGGGFDTAVYDVAFDEVSVRESSDGAVLIELPDGTRDRLVNVEAADFIDGVLEIRELTETEALAERLLRTLGLDGPAPAPDGGPKAMAADLLAKADATGALDADDDTELVAQLYKGAFGRPADADGAAWWTAQLDAGLAPEDAVLAFADSAEAIAHHADLEVGLFDAA